LLWAERDNHAGYMITTSSLDDDTGATIPGLTLQLEMKKPIVVDRCLYELGMFVLKGGRRYRAFQLHISPPDKRSHNDPSGPLYGAHVHRGGAVYNVDDPRAMCGNIDGAFAIYCESVNLTFTGTLNSPL
jgi:hypothetical protein